MSNYDVQGIAGRHVNWRDYLGMRVIRVLDIKLRTLRFIHLIMGHYLVVWYD